MHTVHIDDLCRMIRSVTGDNEAVAALTDSSPLLGAIPEMDSLAIVNLLVALEEKYDIQIDDDDVEQSIFVTLGALKIFVQKKVERMHAR